MPQNIVREKECVLNLPAASMVNAVDRLARLTASDPVPPHKQAMGYRHERNKFEVAQLTLLRSELVRAPRILECPIHLEAVLEQSHAFGHRPDKAPGAVGLEVRVVRAHVDESILLDGRRTGPTPISGVR